MKIHIIFNFRDGAFGGGNQFLKALRGFFESSAAYETNIAQADVIIFNSYQQINKLIKAKLEFPEKVFIHRVDGPIRLYCRGNDRRDYVVAALNELISDGTVFQSNWSREKNYIMSFPKKNTHTIIMNAPDPEIFNREDKTAYSKKQKTRLIASSWSNNLNKGFEVYRWLDKNLDFNKIDMVFVGRTPIKFHKIKHIYPLDSKRLALELKKSDIFIIASQKDPCSNALIEAMHCGLPAIALRNGGHAEIIGSAGELFENSEEIPALIEKIKSNYSFYQANIKLPGIKDIGTQYYRFCQDIFGQRKKAAFNIKKLSLMGRFKILKEVCLWKASERFICKPA